jgi:hypothetical protein
MSRRAVLGALAAGVIVTAGLPAQAAPYAGQHRYLDTGVLTVYGADGATWRLELAVRVAGAVQTEADTPVLLNLDRCLQRACRQVARWRQPLTTGTAQVGSDLAGGVLDTVVAGLPVRASLTATSQLPLGVSFETGVDLNAPSRVSPRVDSEKPADGTITIGRLTCRVGRGALGEVVARIDSAGPNGDQRTMPPTSWPAGLLGARASC